MHKPRRTYNRTMIYLLPALRKYGNNFRDVISMQPMITAGIDDIMYNGEWQGRIDNIFILFNMDVNGNKFLEEVRKLPEYRDDYPYADLLGDKLHMCIFYFHAGHAMRKFLKSEYSKMYTAKEQGLFFWDFRNHPQLIMRDLYVKATGVIEHTEVGKLWFEDRLNMIIEDIARKKQLPDFMENGQSFRPESRITIKDTTMEYDFPIVIEEEVFNYGAEKKYDFFSFIQRNIKTQALQYEGSY